MKGPPVMGRVVLSSVMPMGQAHGTREVEFGSPLVWIAEKTFFGWFESIGIAEQDFRKRVYLTAVCRRPPGKKSKGGDRVRRLVEIRS